MLDIKLNQKLINKKLKRPTDSQEKKRRRKLLEETRRSIEKVKRKRKERKRLRWGSSERYHIE